MSEIDLEQANYNKLMLKYLENKISVNDFVAQYMEFWKRDRDSGIVFDHKFQRLIDRVFTSCDCYYDNPKRKYEISEKQLRDEVDVLRYIWFG